MPAKKSKASMSDDHKASLAAGRAQGRAIRDYLEALDAHKPKRGRKRTVESMTRRLNAIEKALPDADPMRRVVLVQERIDLAAELAATENVVDLSALEATFVEHAAEYSERKGISYSAWREVGVPASALRTAGIRRTRPA